MRLPNTLLGLREAIARRTLRADAALAAQQAAFARHAPDWNCVTHIFTPAPALQDGLPLAGVGLAHKDIFAMHGRRPRCGTPGETGLEPVTASAVQRLENAGARTLGALAMAEYACGATGENPHLPPPVNPFDADAAVGGSSSGSAVAVAAGLCYGSLGTDTAGSVRIPAATCGVVGFKPGYGVLPTAGCHPLAPSLDTVGVLARSAGDAAALFAAMLTGVERSAHLPGGEQSVLAGAETPRDWRVATCWHHPDPAVAHDPALAAMLGDFAAEVAGRARPASTSLPELAELARCADVLLYVETARTHAAALRGHGRPLSRGTRAVAVPGAALPATWYAEAVAARHRRAQAFVARHLREHDVLLTPMLPHGVPDWAEVLTTSPDFRPRTLLALFAWTAFVNYLGLPAVVLPIGQDARGRPVSVQAIGRPGDEALLLAFALAAERRRFGFAGVIAEPPALRSAALS